MDSSRTMHNELKMPIHHRTSCFWLSTRADTWTQRCHSTSLAFWEQHEVDRFTFSEFWRSDLMVNRKWVTWMKPKRPTSEWASWSTFLLNSAVGQLTLIAYTFSCQASNGFPGLKGTQVTNYSLWQVKPSETQSGSLLVTRTEWKSSGLLKVLLNNTAVNSWTYVLYVVSHPNIWHPASERTHTGPNAELCKLNFIWTRPSGWHWQTQHLPAVSQDFKCDSKGT